MRQKIKFPHKDKLIEREVHKHRNGTFYIISKERQVEVRVINEVWTVSVAYNYLYIKE